MDATERGFPTAIAARERRAAAAVAREAEGPTLLLGSPLAGMAEALWERVPRVRHGVEDPVAALELARRAQRRGVREYETFGPDDPVSGVWQTIVLDADGAWGARSGQVLLRLLAPGGRLMILGRTGRPLDGSRPGRHASASGAAEAYGDRSLSVYQRSIPGVARYIVSLHRPPEDAPPTPAWERRERCPVTVIIPSAGSSPWLEAAIESVLTQSVSPEAIIVVSDGGADAVAEAVVKHNERVRLLEMPRGGQAAAMNLGLRHTETEFVAWLDDDDLFLPRKLELQWRDLDAHPEAVLGVTDHYVIDAQGQLLDWRPVVAFDPEQLFRLLLGGSFFLGPTVMVRTEHYRALGEDPYDPSLRRAADYAMWYRLGARGPVRVLRLALSAIRRHAGNRMTAERVRLMRESARRTLKHVVSEWPLERFFPDLPERSEGREHAVARGLALVERAAHLLRVGLVEEALADLGRAIELCPNEPAVRHFHAITLMESGDLKAATEAFDLAADLGAPPAEVACGHGVIAWWSGDHEEAIAHFRQAAATDPAFLVAHYNLALAESRESGETTGFALAKVLMSRSRPHGYLLSPSPPLEGLEAELVRLRRAERGLPT